MPDIIYVLTNRAMPGMVKIGRTERPIEQRMRELDTTGVPISFECFAAWEVADGPIAERALHTAFGDHRVRERREFFWLSPDKPTAILKAFGVVDRTPEEDVVEEPEDLKALEKARAKRPRFSFDMVGIKVGEMLESVFDGDQTCVVAENNKVIFRDEVMSLSQSALILAHETGRNWRALAGPDYWKYEDRTLTDMRNQEEEGD
ncbi:MAG: GIY-YIG nuclease family protein [Pseudomonadota bacterium]